MCWFSITQNLGQSGLGKGPLPQRCSGVLPTLSLKNYLKCFLVSSFEMKKEKQRQTTENNKMVSLISLSAVSERNGSFGGEFRLPQIHVGFVRCYCLKWRENIQSALTITTNKTLSGGCIISLLARRTPTDDSQILSLAEQGTQNGKAVHSRESSDPVTVTRARFGRDDGGGRGWMAGPVGSGEALKVMCKTSG